MKSPSTEKYDVALIGVGVGANYGSVLTYYSLYKTIESFGKNVLMVSKIGAKEDDPEIQKTHAMDFAKEHYNLSRIYSQSTVSDLNEVADTFVIGSDQVWNYGISQHFAKAFYLDFTRDEKRRISYAASFGHAKDFAPIEEREKISELMKRFHAISVREDSGVTIARDVYNVSARQVAEPIFLMANQEYNKLAERSKKNVSEPYLLAYILDPTPEKKEAILHVSDKLGVKPRIILDGWPHLFDANKEKMGIPDAVESDVEAYDFLNLYANCSYVITDSFHGTSFALKFGKPFAAIGNKRRGMARFDSMFRMVGHRERFTLNPMDIVKNDDRFLAEIDYNKINSIIEHHVQDSALWLKSSLELPTKQPIGKIKPHSSARSKLSRIGENIRNFAKDQIRKEKYSLKCPQFEKNSNAWKISRTSRATEINIAEPGAGGMGAHTWCNLPSPLRAGGAYELSIKWTPRTSNDVINIHIRNPETKKFRVIGRVPGSRQWNGPSSDTVTFKVPSDGYSQVMFGAVHFTGLNAGADIVSINVKTIPLSDVNNSAGRLVSKVAKRTPALVARSLSKADNEQFIRYYAQNKVARNIDNARALLMFYSHGFEKGLSRKDSFRPGFGAASMPTLAKEMNKWIADNNDPDDTFFKVAVSVMRSYFDRHNEVGTDVSHFWKLFDSRVQEAIELDNGSNGGAVPANSPREKIVSESSGREFMDIVFSRRTVREFTQKDVDDNDIRRAVQVAIQSPSVCNRQPARVHQFEDRNLMKAALDLQGGFNGYKMPPKLLLVTCDLKALLFAVERNQAFIDGGLFMMSLLLGLEEAGLGACCLNTAMNKEKESSIRRMLNIPESEVFISFIAVGHFDPAVLTPRSKRVALEQVLRRH